MDENEGGQLITVDQKCVISHCSSLICTLLSSKQLDFDNDLENSLSAHLRC